MIIIGAYGDEDATIYRRDDERELLEMRFTYICNGCEDEAGEPVYHIMDPAPKDWALAGVRESLDGGGKEQ